MKLTASGFIAAASRGHAASFGIRRARRRVFPNERPCVPESPRFTGHVFLIRLVLAAVLLRAPPALAGGAPVESLLETRRHHVVLQQWELSCAAAALATVLRYQLGMPVTERSVALGLIDRKEYLQNPDLVRIRQGFSLLDLKRFVDRLGYEGIGLGQLELSDLLERAPIIVPVNLQGYPHFVVFRGATSDTVLLADPAFGNTSLSVDKFRDGWIDYRDIGHVGFVVTNSGTLAPPGGLAPRASEFLVPR